MPSASANPLGWLRGDRARNAAFYGVVVACWVLYLFITFRAPTQGTTNVWNLTEWQLNAIRLTVAVPYLLIWLAAFYGARRLKAYQRSLDEGTHRKAFQSISTGLHWLAFGLLATTLVSSLRNLTGQQDAVVRTMTIVLNYLYVLFPLIGFVYLHNGSQALMREAQLVSPTKARIAAVAFTMLLGALQLFLVFTDAVRSTPTAAGRATYYLPDPLIVLTLVLPFLVSLPFGALATLNLYAFVRKSAAVIYEKTLPPLANGIMMIVVATIILQLLLSLGSDRLLSLGILNILLLIYAFLGIQAAGYLLVAKGGRRLAKLQRTLAKYQEA